MGENVLGLAHELVWVRVGDILVRFPDPCELGNLTIGKPPVVEEEDAARFPLATESDIQCSWRTRLGLA